MARISSPMRPLGKISVGVVLDETSQIDRLTVFSAAVAELHDDTEIVVVANAMGPAQAEGVMGCILQMADTTVHFLEDAVDRDFAKLIVIDNAIGDWILLADLEDIDVSHWRQLVRSASEGFETVMATEEVESKRRLRGYLRHGFLAFYRLITKLPVGDNLPATRIYSRAAALYLVGRSDSIMLLKCATLGSGFPSTQVLRERNEKARYTSSLFGGARKAYRVLNAKALPVRSIVFVALIAAVFNVVYSGYVVFVYLLNWEVAPGWITQSLQTSGMYFLFSIIFALLGERLLAIERSTTHRLRYHVRREVRSPRSSATFARNVVSDGRGADNDTATNY